MTIKKSLNTQKKIIKIALYVLISIPVFFIVLGFLRALVFGGLSMTGISNDSYSPMISKSARDNSLSYEQSMGFEEGMSAPSGGNWNDEYNSNVGQEDKKVIKTASLSLVVEDVEVVAVNIKEIAEALGGSADNRNIYESSNNRKYGNITVRVPSNNFDVALQSIKKDARKVTNENISSQDVTEEYVDLAAQLKNLKSVESQYLEVLQKADTIDDILKVRNVLDRTRSEIERLQGRMLYLERQVAMSTISVSLVSESDVEVLGVVWSPILKIKQAALRTLESFIIFIYAMINIIFFIPVLLLWMGVFIGFMVLSWKSGLWLKMRLFEKKKKKKS